MRELFAHWDVQFPVHELLTAVHSKKKQTSSLPALDELPSNSSVEEVAAVLGMVGPGKVKRQKGIVPDFLKKKKA